MPTVPVTPVPLPQPAANPSSNHNRPTLTARIAIIVAARSVPVKRAARDSRVDLRNLWYSVFPPVPKPFLRGLAVVIGIVSGAGTVLASALVVGVPAPMLDGETLEGRPFDGRWSEGDATVVMFFATYCQPCHRALSELEAIRRTTGPRLRFVLVDAGEDPAIVRKFLAENRTPAGAGVVLDASASDRRRWGCCEIEPTLFLVDRAGRVRYINHGWGEGSEAKYLRRVQRILSAP